MNQWGFRWQNKWGHRPANHPGQLITLGSLGWGPLQLSLAAGINGRGDSIGGQQHLRQDRAGSPILKLEFTRPLDLPMCKGSMV